MSEFVKSGQGRERKGKGFEGKVNKKGGKEEKEKKMEKKWKCERELIPEYIRPWEGRRRQR